MRYLLCVVGFLASVATAIGGQPVSQPPEIADKGQSVATAIERGLAFLVKDALAWKAEHKCASCHHAGLVVWSMREAKVRGRKVDEPVLADLTKWIAESGDGKTGVPRPEGRAKAINTKAVNFALALGAGPERDAVSQAGMSLLLGTVKGDQTENGSWLSWPETRPPIFGISDDTTTTLATLALVPAAAAGDESAIAARDKGLAWLASAPSDDDAQSVAMRLVLWTRMERPRAEWEPLAERIQERQNGDGGWSQSKEMGSDAWATGQALYALACAGPGEYDRSIGRGQAFLVDSQRDDGSWAMTSRPIRPGGAGSTSLVPITGAGSAWAVLGLVRSSQ